MPWALGGIAFVLALLAFPIMAMAFGITLALAGPYRTRLLGRGWATAVPLPLLIAAAAHTSINDSLNWLIANLTTGLALLAIALWLASWRESRRELRNYLDFRAARAFFLQRIVQRDPSVDMRWIPYMLAFGLVPDDRWSVAAPHVPRPDHFDDDRHDITPSGTRPSHARGETFTASELVTGGGAFGGAGSTGSWASIQSFASAVAPAPTPSASSSSSSGSGWSWSSSDSSSYSSSSSSSSGSSSSSSSSSSSGSSSGGGGGGGW